MTLTLVAAPTAEVVSLTAMKSHLRVTHTAEDTLIESLTDAAVAYIDGWQGVLGRCIGAQVWRVSLPAPGTYTLPMPDVTAASAAYEAGATALDITATACGPQIEVTEACDVTFTCEASAQIKALAGIIVKQLVAHWYQNREAAGERMAELPLAADAVIAAIRWRRI